MKREARWLAAMLLASLAAALAAEPDDWKQEANARIDLYRRRDVQIIVVDRAGTPVVGATVRADQTRHRFAFGSCINTNARSNPQYASFFTSHFEWAVFENESKWFINEPQRDVESYATADWLYDFCEQNGILVRGHNLFWAKEEFTPPWTRALPEDELRAEVDERIDHGVSHFQGKFLHWDVNNEMLDGDFFRGRLGSDIEPYMFRRTKEIDPTVKTFVNDYAIMGGSVSRIEAYLDQIRSLEARGGPVDRIGDQAHFWGDTVDPYQILDALDRLSVLNKPVWVTEYDAVDPDENHRADKLENLYRAAFSHPIVEGILMWGFWAGSHWRGPDAAIVNQDFTLNAAGRRYEALMSEWTTSTSGTTDAHGTFPYRGFHGTYSVDVQAGSTHPTPTPIELPPGEGAAAFMIPLKPGSCFAAGEVTGLRLRHDATAGASTVAWTPLPWRPDAAVLYDALRSENPADFAAATCLEANDGSDTNALDSAIPLAGSVFFYLVRGEFDCPRSAGPLGDRSDGTPRTGCACP